MKVITKIFFLSLFCLTTIQAQNTPRELNDLVGMKATYLDNDLSKKGYSFITNEKSGSDSYSYYWNSRQRKCITTRTNNGRVASIVSTMPFDCGKSGNDYNHHDYGYNENHSNDSEKQSYRRGFHDGHKRTRNNPYGSQIQIIAYDRGYDDGYANKPMDSYYAKDDYSHTNQYYNHYSHNNNHNNSGNHNGNNHTNHGKKIDINELRGMKSKAAYVSLEQHGYNNTKTFQEDNVTYKLWFNSKVDHCVKTYSKNYYIARIENSNNCK